MGLLPVELRDELYRYIELPKEIFDLEIEPDTQNISKLPYQNINVNTLFNSCKFELYWQEYYYEVDMEAEWLSSDTEWYIGKINTSDNGSWYIIYNNNRDYTFICRHDSYIWLYRTWDELVNANKDNRMLDEGIYKIERLNQIKQFLGLKDK